MRLLCLILFLFGVHFMANAQQEFYLFELTDISGRTISLKDYRGKKVLIILSNSSSPDSLRVNKISKIIKEFGSKLTTIVIPISDFSSTSLDNSKGYLKKYQKEGIIVTETIIAKKTSQQQSVFLKWLTSKDKNNRFDIDVQVPFQMFAISEKGRLYAVMAGNNDIDKGYLRDILAVNIKE